MNTSNQHDPYAGNILTRGLGPILSRENALAALTYLPPVPTNIGDVPKHVRMHMAMQLRDFHCPPLEEARLQSTIDLMIRNSYRYRDPIAASTWQTISGGYSANRLPRTPALSAAIVGHSGTGKTEATLRSLCLYPQQVICHDEFPRIVGRHRQVVWLSVDIPASGKASDLATSLMIAFDNAILAHDSQWSPRFSENLQRTRRDGAQMLSEWQQVALSHFLGIIHFDEVQNFFKLQTLEQRLKRKGKTDGRPELSIVEDQCLKWILTLTNTWQIPAIFSGTPDGIGALTTRLANIQRVVNGGYHVLKPFSNPADVTYLEVFLQRLGKYQYVKHPLSVSGDLASLIVELTAGIQRLIIALWIAAHRVAFERKADDLRLDDFRAAAHTYLSPVQPAVAALRSKEPKLMARYEDLVRRDDNFWGGFWGQMTAH